MFRHKQFISKADQIDNFETLAFPAEFFKEPLNIERLQEALDFQTKKNEKFTKLNKLLAEFVTDYGLVAFDYLDSSNQETLNRAAALVDRANGYEYEGEGNEDYSEIRKMLATQQSVG